MMSLSSYIHQKHEKPTTLVKKVMREFDRGTRGWFLRKVVPGYGGGGYLRASRACVPVYLRYNLSHWVTNENDVAMPLGRCSALCPLQIQL